MSASDRFARWGGTGRVRGDLKAKSVRAAIAMGVGGAGDSFVRLASVFILARLLHPEDLGLVAMVTAITAVAGEISDLGLSSATVQAPDITDRQVTNLFWINVGFGILLTSVLCAVAPLIAGFYRDGRLVPITMAISTSFFCTGLTIQHEALLTRQMKQAQCALVRLGSTLLAVCLAVTLALHGYGYWALVWQELARSFLVAVGIWLACRWMPGLPSRGAKIGGLLRFGKDLTLTQLLNTLVSNLDRLLLGRYLGAAAVGYYRQAQQLMIVPIQQLNVPIQSVAQPALSMLQGDAARYCRYYQRIVFLVALATMPVATFVAVYAHEATLAVLGAKWIESAPLLRVFALATLIRPVLGTVSVVMMTLGQTTRLLNFSLVRNATLLVFTAVGIYWGAKGVAIAQLANTIVLVFPSLSYGFAGSPISVGSFFSAIRTPIVASCTMAAGLVGLHLAVPGMSTRASLGAGLGVGGALFVAACLVPRGARQEISAFLGDVLASLRGARGVVKQRGSTAVNKPDAGV